MAIEKRKSIFTTLPDYESPFGDWGKINTINEGSQNKSLSIKFENCKKDDKYIYLNFEVTANDLSTPDAEIYVKEIDFWDNATLVPASKVTINPKGTKTITVKYDKDKTSGWSKTIFEGDFEFVATIVCDGLSSKTKEFRIKDCIEEIKKDASDCKKEQVPALNLDDTQKAKFIATVLCETNLGDLSLRDIAWVYYNRVRLYGVEAWNGLNASTPYREKQSNYKLCIYYLGKGAQYASVKYAGELISKYVKQNGWFTGTVEPKILAMKTFIETEIFSLTPKTCYKDWIGQGYFRDLDINPEDRNPPADSKWYMARQYYWLQLQKKVTIKYVQILPNGGTTSFIFDENSIAKYFKAHPELLPQPKDVKRFEINGVLNFDL